MSGRRGMPPHAADQPPVKKHGKWSPEEDALIIKLRRSNMIWDDISKRLPGRSTFSCRQHYKKHLEGQSEWDEELKNNFARLYERLKPEMWAKVAEEMAVPWRAAEAMHWQLGEADMARRAGVIPSSLATVNVDVNNSFLSSHSPRELHSQHSSPQKDDFLCVVAAKFPDICDKRFPDISKHNEHLKRYHSPMNWCKDCLHKLTGSLTEDALAIEMAAHKKSCTKEPSEKNKLNWGEHYIIDEGRWADFKTQGWKKTDVPTIFDQNGRAETISRRSWRQISEIIFPSRPTDTLPLAPCRESIPPPPPLPTVPDPAEVQYAPRPGLAPIQDQPPPRTAGMLPGVAELTSGVSPYITSAAVPNIGPITGAGQGSPYSSFASYSIASAGSKRRASSDQYQHEANQRRRIT
ncbi:hypothetical protein FOMA001_g16970 [Fusarium oxysporum f. sp. matthiolae]|nr:hypothetical protein FOMA001_g16970 [Fusarium oxysporum f. sp. matthiolae]